VLPGSLDEFLNMTPEQKYGAWVEATRENLEEERDFDMN